MGNMLKAWIEFLDDNRNGRLDMGEFADRCKVMVFSGNARQLFRWLLPERGKNFLTLDDVDKAAAEALSRGDYDMITVSGAGNIFGVDDRKNEERKDWKHMSFL